MSHVKGRTGKHVKSDQNGNINLLIGTCSVNWKDTTLKGVTISHCNYYVLRTKGSYNHYILAIVDMDKTQRKFFTIPHL